ncbi:APC family permease [archaeon]|nr:MAG: APC family permease [archaeon]
MSLGYFSLTTVLAELTSITNFAGGTYGYSRCSLGPKYGWLFACCELLQYNFFTIANVQGVVEVSIIPMHIPTLIPIPTPCAYAPIPPYLISIPILIPIPMSISSIGLDNRTWHRQILWDFMDAPDLRCSAEHTHVWWEIFLEQHKYGSCASRLDCTAVSDQRDGDE